MSFVQNPVRISTRRITAQDNMVTIDYPVVKGLESPAAQHRINMTIAAAVNMLMREQGFYEKQKTEMLGWYEIKTCLLYTSPSPRDRTRYRMPSSA